MVLSSEARGVSLHEDFALFVFTLAILSKAAVAGSFLVSASRVGSWTPFWLVVIVQIAPRTTIFTIRGQDEHWLQQKMQQNN
jgi:hypothetical protein